MKKEFIILFLIILLANILLYSSIVIKNNKEQISNVNTIYENGIGNYALDNSTQNYDISQPVLNTAELAKQIEEQRLAKEKAEQEVRKRDEENKKKQEEYQAKLEQERQALINKEQEKNEEVIPQETTHTITEKNTEKIEQDNTENKSNSENNENSLSLAGYIELEKSNIKGYLHKSGLYCIYELANGTVWIQPVTKEIMYMRENAKVSVYANDIKNYFLLIEGSNELISVEKVNFSRVTIEYPTRRIRPLEIKKNQIESAYSVSRIEEQIRNIENNWKNTSSGQIYCLKDGSNWIQLSNQELPIQDLNTVICEYKNNYFMKIYCSYDNASIMVEPYNIESE